MFRLERAAIAFFAWFAPFAWLVLLLAELGRLRPASGLLAAGIALLPAWLIARRALALSLPRPEGRALVTSSGPAFRPTDGSTFSRTAPIVPIVVILAALLVGRPHEMVVGGRDPGVYVNTAILIARSGGLLFADPLLGQIQTIRPALTAAALATGKPSPTAEAHPGLVGFAADPGRPNTLQPHGFPLFPVLLVPFAWIGGLPAVLVGAGLFAVLASAVVMLLGYRLFGAQAGLIAGLLLAINPAEIWHARQSAAEPLAQALLLGGLWLAIVAFDEEDTVLAGLAGVTLGLVHLVKIELVVVPPVIALWLLWRYWTRRSGSWDAAFGVGYGIILVHAVVHALTLASSYTYRIADGASAILTANLPLPAPAALGLLASVALIGSVVIHRQKTPPRAGEGRRSPPSLCRKGAGGLGYLPAVLVTAALLYGLLPRPISPEAAALANLSISRTSIPGPTAQLAWYVTPLGIVLAAAGLWRALTAQRHDVTGARPLALGVLLLGSALVLYQPMVVPDHFWASRRLLPMVLPLIVVLAGYTLTWQWLWTVPSPLAKLLPASGGRRFRPAIVPIAILIGSAVWTNWPFLLHREFDGVSGQIAAIAAATAPGSLLLIQQGDIGTRVALPLWAIHGRNVITVDRSALSLDGTDTIVERLAPGGESVYWLDDSALPPDADAGSFALTLVHAETPVDRLPRRIDEQRVVLTLRRLR